MKLLIILTIISILVLSGCTRPAGIITADCAQEGERFSVVYKEEHPETCCEGLTEWESGHDTSISVADKCYDTGLMSGYPVGTCINCGNGVCEEQENPCNCEDCIGKDKSNFKTVEEFCEKGFESYCRHEEPMTEELCSLCE